MVIYGGRVGIALPINYSSGYTLHVNGVTFLYSGYQGSDLKFKKNLKRISDPLDKVLKLNGVSFEWRKDEFKDKGFPDGCHYSVIAQ